MGQAQILLRTLGVIYRGERKAHPQPPATSVGSEADVRETRRIRYGEAGRRFGAATGSPLTETKPTTKNAKNAKD